MKKQFLIIASFLLMNSFAFANGVEILPLNPNHEIIFGTTSYSTENGFSIQENRHTFQDGELTVSVDNSASAFIYPFHEIKNIEKVSIDWRLNIKVDSRGIYKGDKEYEKTKLGDDFYIRLGLIIGRDTDERRWEDILLKLFPIHWLSQVDDIYENDKSPLQPSGRVLMFVDGAANSEGTQWQSPYEKNRVKMIVGKTNKVGNNWNQLEIDIAKYEQSIKNLCENEQGCGVVGLWVMNDGDSTNAKFEVNLKDLTLYSPLQ